MRLFVYVPLLLPVLAAAFARPLASRLHPRHATALLTTAAVALAACSSAALALLAAAGIARWAALGRLGGLSHASLHHADPVTTAAGAAAAALLAAAALNVAVTVRRRARSLAAAYRHAAQLGGHGRLVVVDDPAPDAFALPGWPGRVVVTSAMFAALDSRSRRALLAHEHAHLACHHHLFAAAARLAAAANPCLAPVSRSVELSVEQWADEHAALTVGDRQLVATTVARAALLAHRPPRCRAKSPVLAISGRPRRSSLAGAGPVPRRVAALLNPPRHPRPALLAAPGALIALAGIVTIEAVHDLATLLEIARAAHPG